MSGGVRRRPRPTPAHVLRRRRLRAAGVLAVLFSALLIAVELLLADPLPVAGPSAASVPAQCDDDTPAGIRQRLGGRFVVRMEAAATRSLRRQARRGQIGGVILFPEIGTDPIALRDQIARLQDLVAERGDPPLLVAIDQEGGPVKRLPGLPPERPPRRLGEAGAAAARAQGLATGRELSDLGVNVNLAPVLDVPETPDSFIAERAFGSDPATVAKAGTAFARGLAEGGVGATAKHFPGIGRAPTNTDLAPAEVDASRTELEADLEPFEAAIDAGIELVMLSNATYPSLDPDSLAFASPAIVITELRDRLGFEGVTITDDLDAGAVREQLGREGGSRAAIEGGVDVLLYAGTSEPGTLGGLAPALRRGRLDRDASVAACARVFALRAQLGG